MTKTLLDVDPPPDVGPGQVYETKDEKKKRGPPIPKDADGKREWMRLYQRARRARIKAAEAERNSGD